MNYCKLVYILLSLIGVAGAILSAVLFVSAIQFFEIGRIILYFITAVVCIELSVLSFLKAFPKKN